MAGTEAGGKSRRNNSREKPKLYREKSAEKDWIEVRDNKTGFTLNQGGSSDLKPGKRRHKRDDRLLQFEKTARQMACCNLALIKSDAERKRLSDMHELHMRGLETENGSVDCIRIEVRPTELEPGRRWGESTPTWKYPND